MRNETSEQRKSLSRICTCSFIQQLRIIIQITLHLYA